ncbi:uncharacterized protein N0V89_000181 [Didymosphaeria variabile]|uniref:DUF3176 domain containing protein n=1 Tax=Didymosphaeria variabile TaxID=1932322 RepID=A0A9W8XUR5_9PLEO|nr:uncharacterized protein N0V89_000181 [Didymosphaeria variabile]KAJ4359626.1 hypothetical protein N0V89_000181 [Didymosphaeria variabile]
MGLDIPQKIERKLARLNDSKNPLRRWSFELASWTASTICMGSIIAILIYMRNQPLSRWPFGLTVITVLAKIAAATLIIPTSEAIGQLKWNWFQGTASREMVDFEIFDKASRGGPWGSVMLLLRTKGKSLAAVGAILTILMLAIDTFFQQVIELPEIWSLQGKGYVPMVTQLEHQAPLYYSNGVERKETDKELATLINEFFIDNSSRPIPAGDGFQAEIPVTCSTGNCAWPLYRTLGVCSACQDVSSLLGYACISSKLDWVRNISRDPTESSYLRGNMCGYFINATGESPVMMTGYAIGPNITYTGQALVARGLPLVDSITRTTLFGGTVHFGHIRNPIEDFIVAGLQDTEAVYANRTPFAQECVLYWCVKAINSTYSLGAYKEEVVETFINSTTGPQPWNTALMEDTDEGPIYNYNYAENVSIRVPFDPEEINYGMTNETMVLTALAFDDVLPFFSTMVNSSNTPSIRLRYWNSGNIEMIPEINPWVPTNNITQHVERLATAVTNLIRSSSRTKSVSGDAFAKEVYVNVQWAWLTFPLLLLILSLLFLVSTIVRVSRADGEAGIWKNSAMPILIYSLPKDAQQALVSSGALDAGSKTKAKNTRIRLGKKTGWRVSGYTSAPATPVSQGYPPPGWI